MRKQVYFTKRRNRPNKLIWLACYKIVSYIEILIDDSGFFLQMNSIHGISLTKAAFQMEHRWD